MSEDTHQTLLRREDALVTEGSDLIQPRVVYHLEEDAADREMDISRKELHSVKEQRNRDREPRGSRGLGPCLQRGLETLDRSKSPEGPTPTRVGAPRDVPVGVGGPELDHSTLKQPPQTPSPSTPSPPSTDAAATPLHATSA